MVDLKKVITTYPNCLLNRVVFRGILMDMYPAEKRTINILVSLYESGIADTIKHISVLDDLTMRSFVTKLDNEYGIASEYAIEGIKLWAKAFDVTIKSSFQPSVQAPKQEPIVHAPIVNSAIVEGDPSDYEIQVVNGHCVIKKFLGFDEPEIVIPNVIDGYDVKTIGKSAFEKCQAIQKIVVPEGVTNIDDSAFSGCTELKEVILPSSLKRLGDSVFVGCAFEEIQLPASLNNIGSNAFSRCRKLQRIDMPNKIKIISSFCFWYCESLKEVLLPDNLTNIGNMAFLGSALININIPASVRDIGASAFSNCVQLSQVMLHEGLTTIGDNAFLGCEQLKSVLIPKSVTSIGTGLFACRFSRFAKMDVTISCYAGSYALEYARKYGYKIQNAAKS